MLFLLLRIVCVRLSCGVFFLQAEDGIRDLVRSRGLGDVYKRQVLAVMLAFGLAGPVSSALFAALGVLLVVACALYYLSLIHI